MLQVLPYKQPGESWFIPFDFSGPLGSIKNNPDAPEDIGEIEDIVVVDMDTNADVTADLSDQGISRVSGKWAYVWLTGGEHGHRYKVTCRVRAATSHQIFEIDAVLPVLEV